MNTKVILPRGRITKRAAGEILAEGVVEGADIVHGSSDPLKTMDLALKSTEPSRVVFTTPVSLLPTAVSFGAMDPATISLDNAEIKAALAAYGKTVQVTAEVSYERTSNGTLRLLTKATVPVVNAATQKTEDGDSVTALTTVNSTMSVHQVITLSPQAVRNLTGGSTDSAKSLNQQLLTVLAIVADALSPLGEASIPKSSAVPGKTGDRVCADAPDGESPLAPFGTFKWKGSNESLPGWEPIEIDSKDWFTASLDDSTLAEGRAMIRGVMDTRNIFDQRPLLTDQTDFECISNPKSLLQRAMRGESIQQCCACDRDTYLNLTV